MDQAECLSRQSLTKLPRPCTYLGVPRTRGWFELKHEQFSPSFVKIDGRIVDLGRHIAKGGGVIDFWPTVREMPHGIDGIAR